MDRAFNILGSLIVLSMIAVVIKSPQTKLILKEFAAFFQGSITAAEHG